MKKYLLVFTVVLLLFGLLFPLTAAAEKEIHVEVNGRRVTFDVPPFINEDGRTMVPVRFIAEEMGSTVSWDGEKRTVTMESAGKIIILGIGNTYAHVNSFKTEFDTAADLVDGRTMVPLRFIGETFGAEVSWDGHTRTVSVNTAPPAPIPESRITIYFSNDQADKLVAETRTVPGAKPTPEQVFEELLKGPRSAGLRPTVPARTVLRSAVIDRGVLYLNLSSHFADDHRGGSAAEIMTIYSIVKSMTELPEIESVMFMLEFQTMEAILGSFDTSEPIDPSGAPL